jgi:RHS repeat-associated protein
VGNNCNGTDIGNPPGNDQPDFATYTRDYNTGFEYAMNRYYSAGYARFLTVDPLGRSARLESPGTWNRYTYAGGDPVGGSDPSGTDVLTALGCITFEQAVGSWGTFDSDENIYLPGVSPLFGIGYYCASGILGFGGGGGFKTAFPECNQNDSQSREDQIDFILRNYQAAASVAAEADADFQGLSSQNFTASTVLGWAAAESGYAPPGSNPASGLKSGNGDYFNMTAGGNWLNQVPCPSGANSYWACFGSFQGAAEAALFSPTPTWLSYNGTSGPSAGFVLGQELGNGASLAVAFQALKTYINYGTNPKYGKDVHSAINAVAGLVQCLQKNYASSF